MSRKRRILILRSEIISTLNWKDVEKNIADRDIVQRFYFLGIPVREKKEYTTHTNVQRNLDVKGFNSK